MTFMQKSRSSSPEKAVEGRAFQVEREQSRWERHTGSFLTPTSSAGFPSFDLWPDWEPPFWSGQMLCLSLYTHRAIHPSAIHTDTYLNPSELWLKFQSPRVLTASWGSLGKKDLFRRTSGVQPRAPDQSISHKEIKSGGQELLSRWWPRGFLD